MLNGILKLNMDSNRLEIVDRENSYELHCGEQLEVLIGDEWKWGRVEIDADGQWYLIGLPCEYLGLSARI